MVEEEDDPPDIFIRETEGQLEVKGPKVENANISEPLKTRQVNIRSEEEPKFPKVGDYTDEDTTDK